MFSTECKFAKADSVSFKALRTVLNILLRSAFAGNFYLYILFSLPLLNNGEANPPPTFNNGLENKEFIASTLLPAVPKDAFILREGSLAALACCTS